MSSRSYSNAPRAAGTPARADSGGYAPSFMGYLAVRAFTGVTPPMLLRHGVPERSSPPPDRVNPPSASGGWRAPPLSA